MNKYTKIGSILIIIGVIFFALSTFNLKSDPTWISVGITSVISVSIATILIDKNI